MSSGCLVSLWPQGHAPGVAACPGSSPVLPQPGAALPALIINHSYRVAGSRTCCPQAELGPCWRQRDLDLSIVAAMALHLGRALCLAVFPVPAVPSWSCLPKDPPGPPCISGVGEGCASLCRRSVPGVLSAGRGHVPGDTSPSHLQSALRMVPAWGVRGGCLGPAGAEGSLGWVQSMLDTSRAGLG